jgi:hypothetical protein
MERTSNICREFQSSSREILLHACSIAHSIICTRLFCRKMHSDWFDGIEIFQGRWQHGEKWDILIPADLKKKKTLFKRDMYVTLVTKGLIHPSKLQINLREILLFFNLCYTSIHFGIAKPICLYGLLM